LKRIFLMKTAEMFTIPSADSPEGFAWRWRAKEGKTESSKAFMRYYDCMADAERSGFVVEMTHAEGIRAPGGVRHNLKIGYVGIVEARSSSTPVAASSTLAVAMPSACARQAAPPTS
jgi:hypothetical protein